MRSEIKKVTPTSFPSPGRVWAEQLAMGMAFFLGVLVFMACFHSDKLSAGAKILGPNYLEAYGWASAIGVLLQLFIHEAGTVLVAWRLKLPLRFRLFPFGAHATAILQDQPRQVWVDAAVGLAGPITGALVSILFWATYHFTEDPFFLGMACVGYFYNLFTLIPILDLEGGWVAPAIAPQVWLLGLIAVLAVLIKYGFNLVLLCVFCFAVPRFILLIRARMPRTDLGCTTRQRIIVGLGFFLLVIGLALLSTRSFEKLTTAVPEAMSD